MPCMSGLEALRQIRETLPDTQVVMLTVSEDDADLLEAIKSGAHGYLLKSLNAVEFLDMLNALQWGEAAMTRRTAAQLIKGLSEPREQALPAETLTQRRSSSCGWWLKASRTSLSLARCPSARTLSNTTSRISCTSWMPRTGPRP